MSSRVVLPEVGPHTNFTYVTGVSGSGKDFYCNYLLQLGIRHIHIGSLMEYYLETPRDKIKQYVDIETQKETQRQLIPRILSQPNSTINAHFIVRNLQSYYVIVDLLEKIKPANIIAIQAPPEQILKRRLRSNRPNQKSHRERDIELPERITMHQEMILDALWIWAKDHGNRLIYIHNEQSAQATSSNKAFLRKLLVSS